MFIEILKITFRKFMRNRTFSILNIIGLSVGITCFFLIGLLIHYELSFDSFHQNKEDIYRIFRIEDSATGIVKSATTPDPLPLALSNDFPELNQIVSFSGRNVDVQSEDQKFSLGLLTTNDEVFDVFTFPFLYGNPKTALLDPYNVVLSYQTSIKFFAQENPIGKTVSIMKMEFKITGVLKEIPENSSIQFDLLASKRLRKLIDPDYENKWHSSGTYTFISSKDKDQIAEIERNLPGILTKYQPDWLKGRSQLALEKLRDIHINKASQNEMVPTIAPSYVILLAVIAFTILLIASFNYTMLMIASYSDRMKEIGVKKIMGATRQKLIFQFLGETMLFALLAMIIGIILTELFLPNFNQLTGKPVQFPDLNRFIFISIFAGITLAVGLISGLYPAFYLSAKSSISLMKNRISIKTRSKFTVSNVLLTAQFTISAILIISLLLVNSQIYFMKNYDLGFDSGNIIAFPTHYYDITNPDQKIETWKNYLLENGKSHGVLDVSISEHTPGYYFNNAFGVMKSSADQDDYQVMIVTSVDDRFGPLFKVELKEGRFFQSNIQSDKGEAVLINETAARNLGFDEPVGQSIKFRHGEGPFIIIGVVKDIHFRSLQNQIEPVVYRNSSNWKSQFFATKIEPDMKKEALEFLTSANDQFSSANNFDFLYISDKYASSYQAEIKIVEIIALFAGLAILLSCLGLFGIIGISMAQRLKEIGIRKVLGASGQQLFGLLSGTYLKPIIISCLVSWPVSYYFINQWLQNYPYRISPGFQWLLAGSFIIMSIAVFVISYHVILAMRNNPIHALRDE